MRRRNEIGYDRLSRRIVKGARHAKQRNDDKDRQRRRKAKQRGQQQQCGNDRLGGYAHAHDRAPREAVGHLPCDKHQQQCRHELRQPHNAQVQGIAGQIVDIPPHGDRLDLYGEAVKDQGKPVESVASAGKRREPPRGLSVGCSYHVRHADLLTPWLSSWDRSVDRIVPLSLCRRLLLMVSLAGPCSAANSQIQYLIERIAIASSSLY